MLKELPFVGKDERGKPVFWKVEATGDWIADSEAGEVYARTSSNAHAKISRRSILGSWTRWSARAKEVVGIEVGLQYLYSLWARENAETCE